MRAASIQDLLDLKRGHCSRGLLLHEKCGGQIVYSFISDRLVCTHGDVGWTWSWVHDRKLSEGKSGLYQWQPPVVATDI